MPPVTPSLDGIAARSSTEVIIVLNGAKVGRVQSFREDISNNIQVLAELGSQYMVELKKGVTSYSFTISRFMCRSDVIDSLKLGTVFSLAVRDMATVPSNGGGQAETLEYFPKCAIQSLSRDYTIGAATVGENASIVTIGKGIEVPTLVT